MGWTSMSMDRTTLDDLEVLTSRDTGQSILDLLDRTRTLHGRLALRRRLRNPLRAASDIRQIQQALSALAPIDSLRQLDDTVLSAAERYIRSNVAVGGRDRFGAFWEGVGLRLWHPEIPRELAAGQESVRALTGLARRIALDLAGADQPALLQIHGERLTALCDEIEPGFRTWPLLTRDHLIRAELADQISEVIGLLAELDALRSMALASQSPGWTTPELVDSAEFLVEARGAFHPFIPDGRPNPIHLSGDRPMLFLTGPNMAGKSTYLKTVALLVLFAQMGMNVPAASARLAPVDVLFTSLNPVENLRSGISFFYAEILRVKEAARILAEGQRALILFDEVFRGTNMKDALDASTQVMKGFAATRCGGSIFASHLSELHAPLSEVPGIRFCQFGGEVRGGEPVFSYDLRPGVSDKRFGLLLLDRAQVPELISRIGRQAEARPDGPD
jgi:DNA mismatch repair ATPase MutS